MARNKKKKRKKKKENEERRSSARQRSWRILQNLYEIQLSDVQKSIEDPIQPIMSSSSSTVSSNDSNPRRCAACRYLRRRCAGDCILSPYFPASNPQRFACVHKIFGASNVARMLQQLPVHQRVQAADAISMEAYWRVQDPVYGSVGIINLLQHEIYLNQYELAKTRAQIAMHTAHHHQQQQQQQQEEEEARASQPVEASSNIYPQQPDPFAPDRTFLDLSHFPDFF